MRSPNFGSRRNGLAPQLVVIHYTAMDSADKARDWLCNPKAEVSAHYLIARDGTCWQLVKEDMRAWHAGAGSWGDVTDVNSRSIGIEIANNGSEPFPEPQFRSLETLLAGITERWSIRPERVIAHSDLAPGRKIDPGSRFDWQRLARQGLSVWPQKLNESHGSFADAARQFGYSANVELGTLLKAFRLRFRPGATGPVGPVDVSMISNLAKRFPVDGSIATS